MFTFVASRGLSGDDFAFTCNTVGTCKQRNELQNKVPTAHPGSFEIAPKDKRV